MFYYCGHARRNCTYIYLHIYTYIYIFVYIYIHPQIHIYLYIFTHNHLYIYLYTYISIHKYIYIYTYLHIIIYIYRTVCAITAAMPGGTGVDKFGRRFPKRTFDVGIAEQHAMTFAAGN
jgi:hypothetical protein